LPKQNPSPQGEKQGYFPSENPKNAVFRRAINDRPYRAFPVGGFYRVPRFPGQPTGDFFGFWGRKWAANGVMHGGGMNVSVGRTASENIWKKISYMT
jgi:hypothetical protein